MEIEIKVEAAAVLNCDFVLMDLWTKTGNDLKTHESLANYAHFLHTSRMLK